jgi:hypothetical protein
MDQMVEIDEGRMKDIFTANQEGKSAKEIAKQLKLPLSTVKSILGEGKEEILEFTDSQLDVLARQYAGLKGKTISVDNANKLRKIFDRIPDRSLDALRRKKIPFLSGLALSRMIKKGMPVKESNLEVDNIDKEKDTSKEKELKIKLDKEKDQDTLEKQLIAAQGQINILKQKLENEKNKVTKPEPNRETGEVPLTIGVAYKHLKDKAEKEKDKKEVKEMAKDDAYAIGMAQAKKSMNDEPPLEKKTITKGHEIAKKILAKEDLKEAKYTINYEVESDSGADDRYTGNQEITVNAFSPKDAVKKYGQQVNKTVKQAQARGSKSILSVYMNYIEKDGSMISDREVDRLNDYASDLIYKGVYDSYKKEDLNKDDEKTIKPIIKQLKKSVSAHDKQAKSLEKAIKNEMKKDDAYAIGMAQAKKVMNDEPPLQKKTIKKGHEIADKILKKEEVKKEQKDRDIPAKQKYSKSGGFYYWDRPVKYNSIKKFYYHPKGAKPFPPGRHTRPSDPYVEEVKEEVISEAGISPAMIATLKKEYEPFRGKTINAARARQLMNILDKFKEADLKKLAKANIPFVSSGSESKLAVRKMGYKVTTFRPMGSFKEEVSENDIDEACWKGYKRVGMKKKNGKMVPNCVPEAIDPFMISYSRYGKHAGFEGGKTLQDIQKKAQELRKKGFTIDKMGRNNPPVKKENAPSEADIERLKKQGMKPRKEQKDHPAAAVYESIAAVKKKAEKSGMPYGVLKKVYDRGMAAWRGGHRPGATQVQWALARVNSFVTKSSGTWGGADKDLAKQVKGK